MHETRHTTIEQLTVRGAQIALLASALLARTEPALADAPTPKQQALQASGVVIDAADPESSVPAPEWALKRPMEMGYLLIALADRAEAAEKAGKHLAAARYYRALGKAVPDRAVSFGKACRAYESAGLFEQAAASCREALGKAGVSVEDHLRFVRVTLQLPGALGPTQLEDIEAVLARLESDLHDVALLESVAYLRCDLGLRLEQVNRLQQCTGALQALGASGPRLLGYEWALSMLNGDTEQARALIERARAARLPPAAIASMVRRLDGARGTTSLDERMRFAPGALVVFALAFVLGAALFLWQRGRSGATA
jgi:tetratricopeptide (TPR) repeat protein